jgi:imidazolonepropionase-like amidohydrolase
MAEDLIVRNVTVIDGSGGAPVANAEVAIAGERFAAIRPSGTAPNGARVVDGRGAYLVPGLWEGHTHLRARPDEHPVDQVARLDAILATYAAAGITTVLELGGPLDIDGRLRERYRTTPPTASADLLFAGPSFTGIGGWPLALHHNHALVREAGDAQSARRMVLELTGETDFVKCIYDGEPGAPDKLPRDALRAIVTAAHERERTVLVHVRTLQDVEEAVDAGADCIEHAIVPDDPADEREAEAVARLLASTGTFYCPTLAIFEQIARSGEAAYLDELVRDGMLAAADAAEVARRPAFGAPFPHHPQAETRERFAYAMRTLPIFRDAGVKIAAGSDVALFMPRPAALLRELQLLARAGLPPGDVLVAATRHSAEKVGKGAGAGTIAPGSLADALLVEANPLDDVNHLVLAAHHAATIRRGHLAPIPGAERSIT